MDLRASIRKPNNAGIVTTTAGNDLVHTLGTNRSGVRRTAIIRKIMVWNNTGNAVTLRFGTRDTTAPVPLFVQYLPTLKALNNVDNEWEEKDIPALEFSVVNTVPPVAANNREGNIYVVASVAGVMLSLEIDEYGS
jgi:hypothetical protein